MRSHYDDFAAGELNKLNTRTTTTINYNNQINNNNSSSNFNNNNNNNSNGAIPYHARENSLPFSYGQISKTSTPLRPTHATTSTSTLSSSLTRNNNYLSSNHNNNNNKNVNEFDFNFDFDFGLNTLQRSNTTHALDYGYGKKRENNYNNNNNNNYVKDNSNYDSNKYNESEKYLNDNFNNKVNFHSNNNNIDNKSELSQDKMIKSQPRLTSPLLVRKTLSNGSNSGGGGGSAGIGSSRSPTRSTSNTIANTYHFSYGQGNKNDNFDKLGLNGHNNNDIYGLKTNYSTATSGDKSNDYLNRTPARHDFDELLRERREKVYNEYRSNSLTTYDLSQSPGKTSPVPPPRRFANGTVQLPSTLPSSLSHKANAPGSLYAPQIPQRSHSQNGKYNYDIEFNINLNDDHHTSRPKYEDEVDNVAFNRRRTNTLDLSPQRQQPQKYQQPLYQTRDIPLASSASTSATYVERNYHTISTTPSSAAATAAKNSNSNFNRETLSPTSMLDIYSTPYDAAARDLGYNKSKQPLEAKLSTSTTTLQRSNEYTTTYGNGHLYGHELNNQHGQQQQQQQQPQQQPHYLVADRETSPIYATTTKKVTTTSTLQAAQRYPSNNGLHTTQAAVNAVSVNNTMDYPSPTSGQRPETPAFPVTPRTPFANGNSSTLSKQVTHVTYQQQQQQQQPIYQPVSPAQEHSYSSETIYGTNTYRPRLNSSLSMANSEPQEVAAHLVKFAKDSSKFWYKPNLSRDEAISLLLNASPGTFVVRDSTTFKNAYGLVLRVAQPPPGTASTGKPDELVRHFLIEPTTRGVRLKGCNNEPVFTSLSALVYEHSINQLALPCLLQIPERDLVPPLVEHTPAQKQLLTQGAACNVLWLFSCDTESLTGEEAIRKAIRQMYNLPSPPQPTEVHFKVTQQGITLTDNTRKKFFRKHYTADIISYCAIDPDHRLWTMQEHGNDNTTVVGSLKKTIFAFVARRSASSKDNQCHIFCDLAINQPASAIVSFVNKTLPTEKQKNYIL